MEDKKTEDQLSHAPKNKEYTVSTELNTKHPFRSQQYDPGDSVDEHKNTEEANLLFNEDEVGQQRENN